MSTFGGITKEYENVSMDRFDGKNLESTMYMLSHFHSDHIVGLSSESFLERLKLNKKVKLYCSEVTRNLLLLESAYESISESIVSLDMNVPYKLEVPIGSTDQIDKEITVTLLPAGHCPGSAMFLIEGLHGRILYTGDFRISKDNLKLLKALFDNDGNPKDFDSIYVDTTFFHPNNSFIPSRDYSLISALKVIDHWLNQGSSNIVNLRFKASLGCEHLLVAISRHFNMKIHVTSYKVKQCLSIGNFSDFFTTDPKSTRIHSCDLIKATTGIHNNLEAVHKRNHNRACLCQSISETIPGDLRTVTFSAMCFTQVVDSDRYCISVGLNNFKICYSLHPSYTEVCQFLEFLKPKKAFANVIKLGSKTPKDYNVQKKLDEIVEKIAISGSLNEYIFIDNKVEIENKLKRQFSQNSIDNLIFDETQSYLRQESKKIKLDSHNLSLDIMELNNSVVDDGQKNSRKRRFSLLSGSDIDEDVLSDSYDQRSSKKSACCNDAPVEHVDKYDVSHVGSSYCFEVMSYMSSDGGENNCIQDIDEDNIDLKEDALENGFSDGKCDRIVTNRTSSNEILMESIRDNLIHSETMNKTAFKPELLCNNYHSSADGSVLPKIQMTETVNNIINLSGDDETERYEVNISKLDASASDIFLESDVTIDLNSSLESRLKSPLKCSHPSVQNIRPACKLVDSLTSSNLEMSSRILPPVFESEPCSSTILNRSLVSNVDSSMNLSVSSSSQSTSVISKKVAAITSANEPKRIEEEDCDFKNPVVCIDLTEDMEDEDAINEACLENDDVEKPGNPIFCHFLRSIKEEDDYDGGYDGGDECESQKGNNNNLSSITEESDKTNAKPSLNEAIGDDDENGRTSGYDSDTSHFNELQKKLHARFEKLYKRKQRKIKIKTRRMNLQNSKDDVIVIDDDSTSCSEDDSYNYDDTDSSSDYDCPTKNHRYQKLANDGDQFLIPSSTSSSESSSTLSSEDEHAHATTAAAIDDGVDQPLADIDGCQEF